jgi:hypothetical protein
MPAPGNLTLEGLIRTPMYAGGRMDPAWVAFFAGLASLPQGIEDVTRIVALLGGGGDSGGSSELVSIYGYGSGTGVEITSPTATVKSRIFRAVDAGRIDLSVNADFDGANWVRDDIAQNARLLIITHGSSGLHWFEAPAGANPITWTPVFQVVAGVVRAAIGRDVLANIPALGPGDTDYLFYVTDYGHLLRWNGAGWEWAPGEEGRAGEISLFAVAPTGNGWKLCDGTGDDGNPGTNIAYLKSDGTTANVVIPNLTAGAYLKAGAAYGGAVNPAVAPTTNAPAGGAPIGTGANGAAAQAHVHTVNLPGDPVPNAVMLPWFRK